MKSKSNKSDLRSSATRSSKSKMSYLKAIAVLLILTTSILTSCASTPSKSLQDSPPISSKESNPTKLIPQEELDALADYARQCSAELGVCVALTEEQEIYIEHLKEIQKQSEPKTDWHTILMSLLIGTLIGGIVWH